MRRSMITLTLLSLVTAACSRSAEPIADRTTAAPAPAVTLESTTSTAGTTTSTAPRVIVTTNLLGSEANALDQAIADIYAAALNPGQAGYSAQPQGLLDQFADRTPQLLPAGIAGDVYRATILDTNVAVAVMGDDVVLAVESEPDIWEVVGAKLTSLDEPAWFGEAPLQVLVIGSDARPGGKVEGHRADSVHILSAIAATGTSSIVGLPRDSWVGVTYESHEEVDGMDKLTHTMAMKGPEVVVETVENLTNVEIDGYLLTGFLGFQQLIDAFGGFTLDVPYSMNDIKSFSNFRPGVQHINGTEALAFSRNRANAPGGDFGRSLNHGLVMQAVLTEIESRGGPEQIPMLIEILLAYCQTDFAPAELLNLAATIFEMNPETATNIVVPGTTGWAHGRNVVFLDDEAHDIFADIAEDGILNLGE